MANQTLLTYLKNVLKLETDLYICKRVMDEHEKMIRQSDPDRVKLPDEPEKPEAPIEPKRPHDALMFAQGMVQKPKYARNAVLVAILAFFASVGFSIMAIGIGRKSNFGIGIILGSFLICALVTAASALIYIVSARKAYNKESKVIESYAQSSNSNANKQYQKKMEEYKKETERYQMQLLDYQKAMDAHRETCRAMRQAASDRCENLVKSHNDFYSKYSHIKDTLSQLYDADIIHPDYRGIIPVSMFVSYIEKDRCPALGGVNGAYNKYEEELRANLIINQLDRINQSLGSIQNSMGTLYRAIQGANENIRLLSAEVKNNQNVLEDSMRRYNESRHWDAQLIADQTAALASIEEEKLSEIRRIGNALNS